MNESESTSAASRFPTFHRLFRFLFSWQTIRRCLFAGACLATLVGLLYAAANWSGARARRAYLEETRDRIRPRTWQEIVPPPVPDEQNFAQTPFLAALFDFVTNTGPYLSQVRDTNALQRTLSFGRDLPDTRSINRWATGQRIDITEWLKELKERRSKPNQPDVGMPDSTNLLQVATAVLEALEPYRPVLDELRTAARRPEARFNVRYDQDNPWGILLPHLAVLRRTSQALQLHAVAELALGHSDRALEDLQLMLRLADSTRFEPFVVGQMIRVSMTQLALQVVWEGVNARRWSAAQLQSIQEPLAKFDFLADFRRSLDAERVAGNITIDQLRTAKNRSELWFALGDSTEGGASPIIKLAPRGWFDQEYVTLNRWYDRLMDPALDVSAKRIHPGESAKVVAEFERTVAASGNALLQHNLMTRLLLPNLSDALVKAAFAQTSVNLARIALALERYRLAENSFPDTLSALAPRFIPAVPHDVITGEPPRYRRIDVNHFVLYSVGWNEKDDGGVVATAKPKSPQSELREGDWVWKQTEAGF